MVNYTTFHQLLASIKPPVKEICKICGGLGVIRISQRESRICECVRHEEKNARLAQYLNCLSGYEIPLLTESPLTSALQNRQSLRINVNSQEGALTALKCHIKTALKEDAQAYANKKAALTWLMVTPEELTTMSMSGGKDTLYSSDLLVIHCGALGIYGATINQHLVVIDERRIKDKLTWFCTTHVPLDKIMQRCEGVVKAVDLKETLYKFPVVSIDVLQTIRSTVHYHGKQVGYRGLGMTGLDNYMATVNSLEKRVYSIVKEK